MFDLFLYIGCFGENGVPPYTKALTRQMPGEPPQAGNSLVFRRPGNTPLCEVVTVAGIQRIYQSNRNVNTTHLVQTRVLTEGIRCASKEKAEEIVGIFLREHGFEVDEDASKSVQKEAEEAYATMKRTGEALRTALGRAGIHVVGADGSCPDCGPNCDPDDGCCKTKLN